MHHAIAVSCASAIDGVVSDPGARDCLALAAVEVPDLVRRFAGVSDGRIRRRPWRDSGWSLTRDAWEIIGRVQ